MKNLSFVICLKSILLVLTLIALNIEGRCQFTGQFSNLTPGLEYQYGISWDYNCATFSWSVTNGVITAQSGSGINIKWNNNPSGSITYSRSQNINPDYSCDNLNHTYYVSINSWPVTITPSSASLNTITGPTSVVLTASAPSCSNCSYTWSPSKGLNTTSGTSVTASPGSTTTYTVIAKDGSGLTATSTVTVTVSGPCCISSKSYNNQTLSNTYVSGYILATNETISSGQNIVFQAGNYIDLNESFIAVDGSLFTASIGPCSYNTCKMAANLDAFTDNNVDNSSNGSNQGLNSNNIFTPNIYPNPTNGDLIIDLMNNYNSEVYLYNDQGKEVYRNNNVKTNSLSVDLSDQEEGIYFVKIKTNGQVVNKKIVISR